MFVFILVVFPLIAINRAEFCNKKLVNYSPQFGLRVDFNWLLPGNGVYLAQTEREYNKIRENVTLEQFYSQTLRSFVFPPYSLLPGTYTLGITPLSSERRTTFCSWSVKPLPPIAIITGEKFRNLPAKTSIYLQANESIDDSVLIDTNRRKLRFEWRCKQKLDNFTFCKPGKILATTPYMTIPPKFAKFGQEFDVEVVVSSSFGLSSKFVQKISVGRQSLPEIILRCNLNCFPHAIVSNCEKPTDLTIDCFRNCNDRRYIWRVKPLENETNSFESYGDRFVIGPNMMSPGKYAVTIGEKFTGDVLAEIVLEFKKVPQIDQCELVESNKSEFYLDCSGEFEKSQMYIELFVNNVYQEDYLLTGPLNLVNRHRFSLPSIDNNLYARICTIRGKTCKILQLKVPITTKRSSKFDNSIEMIFDNDKLIGKDTLSFYEQVKKYLSYSVIDHKQVRNEEERNDFTRQMMEMVKELKLTLTDLKKLLAQDYRSLETELQKKYCQFLTRKYFRIVSIEKYPRNLKNVPQKVENLLEYCKRRIRFKKNLFLTRQGEIGTEGEGNAPYPDTSKELHDLYNSSMTAAKTISKTMGLDEFVQQTVGTYRMKFVKAKVETITHARLNFTKVRIIIPYFLPDPQHAIELLVISNYSVNDATSFCLKNQCWEPSTKIFGVQVWHANCVAQVRKFYQPLGIDFLQVSPAKVFNKGIFAVPENYDNLPMFDLNYYIQVYKFSWRKNQAVILEFHNLSRNEYFLAQVMDNQYPTGYDIDAEDIYSKMEPRGVYEKPGEDDATGYIGIMASYKQGYEGITLSYTFSLQSYECINWYEEDIEDGQRKFVMEKGKTIDSAGDTVHCAMEKPGLMYAHYEDVSLFKVQVNPNHFILRLESRHLIFGVVATLLFIYCIALIFTSMRAPKDLYFLPDNKRTHRYCYLVLVRTAAMRNSGTTSNVMIRLFGHKSQSDAHVLNYPDPEMRLLQRDGEDMFVLATHKHLGRIQRIHLWYSCTGPSPAWVCKDVMIFDMQLKKEYKFKVNTKFAVVENGVVEKSFTPHTEHEKKLSLTDRIKVFNIYHTWHFTTHDQENFSNMKRVTLILSNILSIQVLDMFTHGMPALRLKDAIDYYEYFIIDAFTVYSGVFCALLSFILHITIAWTFRFSRIKFPRYEQSQVPFPYEITVLCWCLLTAIIVSSITLLVTFGFWVPNITGLVWLMSSTIALANDVLIYENLFILVQTRAAKPRMSDEIAQHYSRILRAIESQRALLHRKLGGLLLRPYLEHLYRRMSKYEEKEKRNLVQQRRNMVYELEDMAMFGIYIVILFVSIFTNRAPFTINAKESLEEMLNGVYSRAMPFDKIVLTEHFYDYVNDTLLNVIHPEEWYERFDIDEAEELIDASTKYFGVVRIRQHRMRDNYGCQVPESMSFMNVSCTPEYLAAYEEQRHFGGSWSIPLDDSPFEYPDIMWQYEAQSFRGPEKDVGQITTYPGSGYVAYLGRTRNKSQVVADRMRETMWVDNHTRCIIIEFLTYNANYNIFSSIKLLLEFSSSGYVHSDIQIQSEKMLYMSDEVGHVSGITGMIYVFWVCIVFIKQAIVLVKKFNSFYKNIWFMMDLSLNMTSICTICLFLTRILLIRSYMRQVIATKSSVYVDYSLIFFFEHFLTILQAFLVTVGTIRLWRYLRFGIIFLIMERTLILACSSLGAAALAFAVVLFAFSLSGMLILGNDFKEFYSIMDITRTLITMCLKPDQFQITSFIETDIAYVYFSWYLVLITINMNVFVSVTVLAYMKAQLEYSSVTTTYNLRYFIADQLILLPKLIKTKFLRLRGGQSMRENRQWIEPKRDEFLYADSVSTEVTTMNAMMATTKCCLRNASRVNCPYLTMYDIVNMSAVAKFVIDVKHRQTDDLAIFFKGRIEGQNLQLVDEKKIELVAQTTQEILSQVNEEADSDFDNESDQRSESTEMCCALIRKQNRVLVDTSLRLALLVHYMAKAKKVVDNF